MVQIPKTNNRCNCDPKWFNRFSWCTRFQKLYGINNQSNLCKHSSWYRFYHCYAFVYPDMQERFQFAPGDTIEFRSKVELDEGRLVFNKLNSIEFIYRSKNPTWSNSKALVVKHTIIPFDRQPKKCQNCDQGVLVDVIDKSRPQWERSRELFCLKSFPDPEVCYHEVEKKLFQEIDYCQYDSY